MDRIANWLLDNLTTRSAPVIAILGVCLALGLPVAAGEIYGPHGPLPLWLNMAMPLVIICSVLVSFICAYGTVRGVWMTPKERRLWKLSPEERWAEWEKEWKNEREEQLNQMLEAARINAEFGEHVRKGLAENDDG